MRTDALQYLACPECSGTLELQPLGTEGEHVVSVEHIGEEGENGNGE